LEAAEIVTRMNALLEQERAAVARLDGAKVLALAGEKLALANALETRPRDERARHASAIKKLVQGLKNNGVLLSHARGILTDLLRGQGVTLRGTTGSTATTLRPLSGAAARHLSVRG
jgi:hypothetical protein